MFRLLSAALLCAAALLPAGCQDKKTTAPLGAAAGTAGRKAYERDEFEKMVMGKSTREVASALGNPDSQVQAGAKEEWIYAAITKNGAKADISTKVIFQNGRVAKVEFPE